MKILSKIFAVKRPYKAPPLPTWKQTVKIMYDKNLSAIIADEILQVVYTQDKEKRLIVIRNDKGLYEYWFEQIFVFDEDEWHYVSQDKDSLPGMWTGSAAGNTIRSLFSTEEEAIAAAMNEPWYKQYFLNKS